MSNHAVSSPPLHAGPTIVNRKVPVRRKNADYRNREYLSEKEVNAVVAAASQVLCPDLFKSPGF